MRDFFFASSLSWLVTACSGDGATTSSAATGQGGGASASGSGASVSGASVSSSSVSGSSSTSSGAGGMGAFSLTSTGFTEGAPIPTKYSCKGANVSPDLTWAGAPAAAKSYAVILTDQSNMLVHWALWDIPAATTSLPEHEENAAMPAVPAGAKQVKSYDGATFGYLGPCPGTTHTYRFVVHALDVATLPSVTTASTRPEVETAVLAHSLGSASLSGTFTP